MPRIIRITPQQVIANLPPRKTPRSDDFFPAQLSADFARDAVAV